MADKDFVTIKELATQLRMDRSHARRYVLRCGYTFHRRRPMESKGQLISCVTQAEADEISARRSGDGFAAPTVVSVPDIGVFYVIQLVPDLDPKRVKLGFAENIEYRLAQHRTAAPTAWVCRVWPCKRAWEQIAIDALTSLHCRLILNEVFECDDIPALLKRGDAFFHTLPKPDARTPLAKHSPLSKDMA